MQQNSLAFVLISGATVMLLTEPHGQSAPDFRNVDAAITGLIFHWYWTLFMIKMLLKNFVRVGTTVKMQ